MQTARIFNNGNSQAVLLPTKYNAESLLTLFKEIGLIEIERESIN